MNLFGLSGEERFDAMFAEPSSSNAQAASSKPPPQEPPPQEAAAHMEADVNVEAESNVEVAPKVDTDPNVEAEAQVEAEAHVEADAEAHVEALSQPEAPPEEELDRRVRGPNVHSSPSTLAELAPPGCSILLNSYLAHLVSRKCFSFFGTFCASPSQVTTTGFLRNGRLVSVPKSLPRKRLTRMSLEAGGTPWRLCTAMRGHCTGRIAKSQALDLSAISP